MRDADTLGLLIILLCLGGSMFFSGSETAITSMGDHHARKILEDGGRDAKTVKSWVTQPVRVLSTILVGNNLANILMGSTATAMAIHHLAPSPYSEYAVPLATIATTALLLVFGEILPKAYGRVYSHRFALPALRILGIVGKVIAPITWVLTGLTNVMLSRSNSDDGQHKVTSDDLDYLVKVGAREGSIPADQAELLRGIFRFEDKIVRDIMVPQDRVTAIDLDWDVDRVMEVARASGNSRMPVFENDLDAIKGVLHIKSLVAANDPNRATIEKVMRPPMFVSESLLISDLLQRFKEQRVHLAIVVDDGGHTVGVVTLEDVLEQIVGKIFDESDVAPSHLTDALGIKYVDGTASLRTVEEMFGVEYEEFDGVDSVGDLLTQLAGQIPIAGSVVVYEGLRFKVLAANARRVIRVSVERVEIESADS
jgi:CBS domain containing-hemolysin-like protein